MDVSTDSADVARTPRGWKRRLVVVAGAVVAAVAVYLVATLIAGQDLRGPAMNDRAPAEITVGAVLAASAFVSLLGWALLALLERFTARARTIWTIVALVVLLVSLGGPLTGTGVSTGNRVGLVLLHLAVAAVLIPLLPGRSTASGAAAG